MSAEAASGVTPTPSKPLPPSTPPGGAEAYAHFFAKDHDLAPKSDAKPPEGGINMHRPDQETRDQMAKLLLLPKEQLFQELDKWPRFQQMDLDDREKFVKRLADIRDRQWQESRALAQEIGLKLVPTELEHFHFTYWQKRIEKEKALMEKITPLRQQMDEEVKAEMVREFGGAAKK